MVAKGEGQLLEFKPGNMRPAELASSLSAFANADGGTLLLGVVEQPDGTPLIEGVRNRKVAVDHLHTAAGLCSPKLALTAPEEVEVGGCLVLAVTVPGGLRQVYGADGRYVVREGSFRRTLGAEEIRGLLARRGLYAFDRQPVPGARRADLDPAAVRAYAARFRSGRRMGTDALLEARELLVRPEGRDDAPAVPSVAGLLLLGKDPQRFFPQARVAVVQYAGTQMGERFLKREIEGTMPAQLEEAEAWLARVTLRAVELRGMGRTDRDDYPREALREAVLNALAHRDYGQRGDRIRIYAFADRIEVHSPGGLGGRVPACGCRLDNLREQRWSRNATLVQGLVAMDIIEELGFGLDRMVAAMGAAGLPAPGFREVGDTFVVTLRGPGTQLFGPAPARGPGPEAARPRASPRLQARRTRQAWALDRMRPAGPPGVREYAARGEGGHPARRGELVRYVRQALRASGAGLLLPKGFCISPQKRCIFPCVMLRPLTTHGARRAPDPFPPLRMPLSSISHEPERAPRRPPRRQTPAGPQANMFAHSRMCQPLTFPFTTNGSPRTYSSAASREAHTAIVLSGSSGRSRNAPAMTTSPRPCISRERATWAAMSSGACSCASANDP